MARLLVVDDEPDLRELLRVSLAMAGHSVEVAADGIAGLARAHELVPDAMVLDVMMPGLDGWTVLAAIKSDPQEKVASIPVVMLTARADDLDVIRGGIEGAVRYLTKPFAIDDLRSAVADAVAGGPEPQQRRAAQQAALVHLATLERGSLPVRTATARPRMTRLEPVSGARYPSPAQTGSVAWPSWVTLELLTQRDQEILAALLAGESVNDARAKLGVSRSYLYARLRSLAGKLGFANSPALLAALRTAHALRDSGRAPS
ncbi:MAG TPA: response regulator [Acidimicrobiales bacterium]|nr:response regulator [Acidimicrobiales bacterium]